MVSILTHIKRSGRNSTDTSVIFNRENNIVAKELPSELLIWLLGDLKEMH